MTKRELQQAIVDSIEQRGRVALIVGEFSVSARLQWTTAYKRVVLVFVDGQIDGKVLAEMPKDRDELPEICRRFYSVKFVHLWKQAQRARITKTLGKRGAQEFGVDSGFWMASPSFTSANAFARNLLKHNDHIEIVATDTSREVSA